jgi:hypothetical protein
MTQENGTIQRKIFAHHKSHMDRLGIERGPARLKAGGDQPSEPCHGLLWPNEKATMFSKLVTISTGFLIRNIQRVLKSD